MINIHKKRRKYHSPELSENKIKKEVKMYSPWVIFSKQVEKLFEKDPEVRVEFDDSNMNISIYVEDNLEKAEAIAKLMPIQKQFGNINVDITVIPPNNEFNTAKYLEKAFEGNGAFDHITTIQDIPPMHLPNPITYCVFEKEVVQYAADNLGSESGMSSTLYEDIAREIFGDIGGIYFCTASE